MRDITFPTFSCVLATAFALALLAALLDNLLPALVKNLLPISPPRSNSTIPDPPPLLLLLFFFLPGPSMSGRGPLRRPRRPLPPNPSSSLPLLTKADSIRTSMRVDITPEKFSNISNVFSPPTDFMNPLVASAAE